MKKRYSLKLQSISLLLLLGLLLSGCTKAQPPSARSGHALPAYTGEPSVVINNNQPDFTESDLTTTSFEHYSDLDALGRCGVAYACIGKDLMPTGERESIREIHPTGWHAVKYAGIDQDYLYNRCHLIAYSLAGESANEKNLITGTRYLNNEGMNPYEVLVAQYIDRTAHHVLYRVTPVFEGNNLVASGVEMEALSVEDDEISFHVYCFNVQPGVTIDYATGDSTGPPYVEKTDSVPAGTEDLTFPEGTTYILNTNTLKFHRLDCESVTQMNAKNRAPTDQSREQLLEQGYKPCGSCKP